MSVHKLQFKLPMQGLGRTRIPPWAWLLAVSLLLLGLLIAWPQRGDSQMAAGMMTVNNRTSASFEQPAGGLTPAERAQHIEADLVFDRSHVPLNSNPGAGLGPLFIANSCVACHVRNGRGQANTDQALVRVALTETGGIQPVPRLGSQVQNRAVWGVTPEATVRISWQSIQQREHRPLRQPEVKLVDTQGIRHSQTQVARSLRIAPPLVGLGLLEQVPEDTILALADPDDQNGDGISGRPHWLPASGGISQLGRFGWKATQASIRSQSAAAYNDDMGLTTPATSTSERTVTGEPADISNQELELVTYYSQTLGAPRTGRSSRSDLVRQGQQHFEALLCSRCHVPQLTTSASEKAVVGVLNNQTIWPYTDLLLHDMGPSLDDGVAEKAAASQEWRTAPLWGIGLTRRINPQATYLHDGRARSLDEAIRWHGGEAAQSLVKYLALTERQRGVLLRWLEQL